MRPREPRPAAARRTGPSLAAALLVVAAGLATAVGVDPARRPLDARALARAAAERSLDAGAEDPAVRAALADLRASLGARPLDSATRALYASLLLAASRRVEDRSAAAFHARRAAELAPVTVQVVQLSALVLARAGETERGLALAQRMFAYDVAAAAKLLARFEPSVDDAQLLAHLPEDPAAWLAWSWHVRERAGAVEADRWLVRLHARWPAYVGAWRLLAEGAARAGDWDTLAELLPPQAPIPPDPEAASLWVCRARLRNARGDAPGARADLERALALGGASVDVMILAGEAYQALGDQAGARRLWNRALYTLPAGGSPAREQLRVLLARLEERYGEPAAALRLWELVLRDAPGHEEARQRSRALGGGAP